MVNQNYSIIVTQPIIFQEQVFVVIFVVVEIYDDNLINSHENL